MKPRQAKEQLGTARSTKYATDLVLGQMLSSSPSSLSPSPRCPPTPLMSVASKTAPGERGTYRAPTWFSRDLLGCPTREITPLTSPSTTRTLRRCAPWASTRSGWALCGLDWSRCPRSTTWHISTSTGKDDSGGSRGAQPCWRVAAADRCAHR